MVDLNRLLLAGVCIPGLVHEVNNPLHVVAATAEMMLADPDLPPALAAKVERMFSHANRASATLLQFMAFFRAPSEPRRRLDLVALVQQVIAMREVALKRGPITLSFEPPGGQAMVLVRASEIAQLFLNLILNAESAVAAQKQATIRVAVEISGDRCRGIVTDSGLPVDSGRRAHVLEAFVPARSTDVDRHAGLRASSVLADRNGGRLSIDDVASGARFVLDLPLA